MVSTSHNRSITAHLRSLVGRLNIESTDEMGMGTAGWELSLRKNSQKRNKNTKNIVVNIRSFFKKK